MPEEYEQDQANANDEVGNEPTSASAPEISESSGDQESPEVAADAVATPAPEPIPHEHGGATLAPAANSGDHTVFLRVEVTKDGNGVHYINRFAKGLDLPQYQVQRTEDLAQVIANFLEQELAA